MLDIEVVFIPLGQKTFQVKCSLAEGACVGDAIRQSGLLDVYPEVLELDYGIFSRKVSADTQLKNGDRVEVYRKLTNDPKEKRRIRAKAVK
ncbi:RnfH family protein [Legionella genomosp. 1]|uniref:RnfH family protein n=1 Tax=Legionella genomosp. 1 TaxID=1093625 RepID=UPI001054F253|nr:RnfH family protein [Legionella genomosp. 1]